MVGAAVLEGMRSNRWGASEDLKAAAAKLQNVPTRFGRWSSTDNPIDAEILKKAEAVGSISRVYERDTDHAKLAVLLLCGRSGPIGAHTPDICYAGLGYKMNGREVKHTIGESSYWTGRFEKQSGDSNLMVSWAWGIDGTWVAAEQPRVEFVGRDALYKLYATRPMTSFERENTLGGPDPTREFLQDFLPEVKKALAPAGAP
jgi:hypothetical protein